MSTLGSAVPGRREASSSGTAVRPGLVGGIVGVVRSWFAVFLVVAFTVQLSQVPEPAPAAVRAVASASGLPEAPRQQTGRADGGGAAPDTRTALKSPDRTAIRPPGAVPDRIQHPAVRDSQPARRSTVTDVPVRRTPREGGAPDGGSVEVPGSRTANSTVFRNPDGTLTRRVFSGPRYAKRPDGSWAPIDLDLAGRRSGRLAPKLAPHHVSFAGHAAGQLAKLAWDDSTAVWFELRDAARVPGRVADASVTYPGVRPGADVRLTATAGGIKEEIILRSSEAPDSYEFVLGLRGLTPVMDSETGDVRLTDRSGRLRAVLPAGRMWDASGAGSDAVHYGLSSLREGRWLLRVTVDPEWLRHRDRAFPVTVDPSVRAVTTTNAGLDDTYVTTGVTADRSGLDYLKIGREAAGVTHAAYLHFPGVADALADKYVVGATLALHNVESGSCSPQPVDVFAVGAGWTGSALRSWPGAPVGRFLRQRSFGYNGPECTGGGGWGYFPLPAELVTDWTHGTPFHGLSVRAANESDQAGYKRFSSANAGNAGVPYLDVTYSDHGAAYTVEEVTLPTNNRNGRLNVVVRNRGASTWTSGGAHTFGFIVKQDGVTVRTSPKFTIPGTVGPNQRISLSVDMGPLEPDTYRVYLTMYNGAVDYHSYGVPYGVFDMKVVNVPPSVVYEQPGSGAEVASLTPTLYADGNDTDAWPAKGLRYWFRLCEGPATEPTNCTDSGWQDATWAPPAGRLKWSTTYHWWVRAHDTINAGPFAGPLALTTTVPQPQITAHLGGTPEGAPAPGLDPQVGNFGTSVTDARAHTVGPDLSITRTYNSLDPRTDTAFGQGWASQLDTQLTHDRPDRPDLSDVVVTLPTGRQVRFGRNTDGSYAPPKGQNLTLVYASDTGTYTLRDASGSRWVFNAWGRLKTVTDPSGLTQELEYDAAGPTGKPKSLYDRTSGRRLHLTWTDGHVTEVRTDPPSVGGSPLVWRYSYDGHALTTVCDPGPAPNCTRYGYQPGSHYRSVVLDDNPRGYWRLGESVNSLPAASVTARKPGADAGSYVGGVGLGGQGALGGTPDGAAAFNGADSFVRLPTTVVTDPDTGEKTVRGPVNETMSLAAELWFRTTSGGVLLSYANQPFGSATASTLYVPVLYVGQDGHLRGGFWMPDAAGPRQAVSAAPVDDGQWHHVVLSGAIDRQTLYLDGVVQGTITGVIDHDRMPYLAVGTGKTVGWTSGNNGDYYFAGHIDEVALYQHPLGRTAVRQHFASGRPVVQLSTITTPQDNRVAASLTYDTVNDRVATYTDHDGRTWRLDPPVRDEAVRTVVLHGPYPDWTYTFDADHGGRLTGYTHDGKTRRYEYNSAGFLSSVTDELGHEITSTTDSRGNVLSRTTCRAPDSCQTSYATYHVSADPLDPRNDRTLTESDARSSGPSDTTYRTSYTYDAAGRMVSATYPKPNGVTTNPTETWRYATGSEPAVGGGTVPAGLLIEHTGKRSGQVARYAYRATGELAEEVAPGGLRIRYTHDWLGRRTSRTEASATGQPFGTTTYTYTARSLMDTETGPAVTNPVTGVVHRLVTRYGYDANGNTTSVTLTDTAGADPPRVTRHTYDEHDKLASTTFPDGGVQTWESRNAGREIRVTDPAGTTWIDYYDSQSRLTRRVASGPGVDPEDSTATVLTLEMRSYDAAGRLARVSDAMGRETTYTYYDDDRLASVARGGVVQAEYVYDAAGNLTRLTAAGGRVTTTTYDPAGYPATVTVDPDGLRRKVSYLRGPDGLVRTESRTGAADPDRTESVHYGYDAAGRLVREDVALTLGDTLTTSYVRDERGLVTRAVDRRRMTTDYTYDAAGRLVTETLPEVETWVAGERQTAVRPRTTYGHNAFGDLTHRRDPNGALTVMGYDAAGRHTTTQLPDYTPPGGTVLRPVTRTGYDKLGNPVSVTDPLGRVTSRTYDPYGRLLTETVPQVGTQPSTTYHTYDRNGELRSVTDPAGRKRLFTYDQLGRMITESVMEREPNVSYFTTRYEYNDANDLTTVTSPGGAVSRAGYNAAGELVRVTDPTHRVTTYGYDIAGRRTSVTDPAGVVTSTDHDLLGRPTATAQLAGVPLTEHRRWSYTHDPNGNLTSVTTPEGRLRSFGYDAADRLIRQDERVSDTRTIRTTFGYDAAGNRTRFVDGRGNATDYTYTPWGLPESVIEPGGATWTAAYDAAGRRVRDTAPGGVTVTSVFDDQDRLIRQLGAGAEAPTAERTFGYDPAGRLTSFGTPDGPQTVSYNDRGLVTAVAGPAGDASFGYDLDGRLATRVDASGTVSYTHDAAGRPVSVVDELSGRTVDHVYDSAGRLSYTAERGMETYVKRVRTYDPLGRPASDKVTEFDPYGGTPRVILGTEYGYDRDDNLVSKTSIAENVTARHRYGYDSADRLTSWTAPDGTVTSYEWDDAGNRIRAGDATYTFNARNQLLTGDGQSYTYTPRGTLESVTGAGTRTLRFDAFDRLVSDGVSYQYDSLGRVATRDGVRFTYGGLDNDVVSDGLRLISRGAGGEPISDKTVGSTTTAKLLYSDQHGDVVGRYRGLDSYGRRAYDPFGTVTESSGEQSSLGFQGEWTDPATGAVNMHSRWYTPASGTFTSRDTWTVPPHPSVAGNRYTYANANPLVNADPTGHFGVPPAVCVLAPAACVTAVSAGVRIGIRLGASLGGWLSRNWPTVSVAGTPVANPWAQLGLAFSRAGSRVKTGVKIYANMFSRAYQRALVAHNMTTYRGTGVIGTLPGGPAGSGVPGWLLPPVVLPPPPPPPQWAVNIRNPAPRRPAGDTTNSRPPLVRADHEGTRVIDRSAGFADEATRTTIGSAGSALTGRLATMGAGNALRQLLDMAGGDSRPRDDLDERSEDCLSGTAPTGEQAHRYWGLDARNRATGADTCLSGKDLLPGANRIKPYKASASTPVAGYDPAKHHKGHLIGAQFRGRGDRSDNLVPLTRAANVSAMYHDFEKCVADELKKGLTIYYTAVPTYHDSHLVPDRLVLTAVGRNYYRALIVENTTVYHRGARKSCH